MQVSVIDPRVLARRVEERIEAFIGERKLPHVYVMVSGGKDSSAALAAAVSCCPDRVVAVYNHIAGQTIEANSRAVKKLAEKLGLEPRIVTARSPESFRAALASDPPRPGQLLYVIAASYRGGMDYWSMLGAKGVPVLAERLGRGVRWCCSEYKEKWWRLLPRQDGRRIYTVTGVKRADSWQRARRWTSPVREIPPFITLAPLYDLSDADVWSLLRHYGVYDVVREQYAAYGQSPNCALCPFLPIRVARVTLPRLPTGLLLRAYRAYEAAEPRGRQSERLRATWLTLLREELERRGVKP